MDNTIIQSVATVAQIFSGPLMLVVLWVFNRFNRRLDTVTAEIVGLHKALSEFKTKVAEEYVLERRMKDIGRIPDRRTYDKG